MVFIDPTHWSFELSMVSKFSQSDFVEFDIWVEYRRNKEKKYEKILK